MFTTDRKMKQEMDGQFATASVVMQALYSTNIVEKELSCTVKPLV